jgi:hypothetical protein
MPFISRRLGVALLVASTVFTMVSASAANLNLTGPGVVGAGDITIAAPCTSVAADYTYAFRPVPNAYFVDTVTLDGTGCAGTGLTVRVTLNNGGTNPETVLNSVDSSTINSAGTGPLSVDVSANDVRADELVGIAVLITG